MTYPRRLVDDAIVEALCEIRFSFAEQEIAEEVVVGRLIDAEPWRTYHHQRLPVSDMPARFRRSEENLRFQPLVELRSPNNDRFVRLGANVASLHVVGNYCGWAIFQPELKKLADALFEKVPGVEVSRLGFRYINVFTEARHLIQTVYNLNFNVTVGSDGNSLNDPVNLNFIRQPAKEHSVTTRIASPEFARGHVPGDGRALVDIDVSTPADFKTTNMDNVLAWIDKAHRYEKEAFFGLVPKHILDKLRRE